MPPPLYPSDLEPREFFFFFLNRKRIHIDHRLATANEIKENAKVHLVHTKEGDYKTQFQGREKHRSERPRAGGKQAEGDDVTFAQLLTR